MSSKISSRNVGKDDFLLPEARSLIQSNLISGTADHLEFQTYFVELVSEKPMNNGMRHARPCQPARF